MSYDNVCAPGPVWLLVQVPSRDLMLNDFFTKKIQMVTALKNIEDMMKLKRSDSY